MAIFGTFNLKDCLTTILDLTVNTYQHGDVYIPAGTQFFVGSEDADGTYIIHIKDFAGDDYELLWTAEDITDASGVQGFIEGDEE